MCVIKYWFWKSKGWGCCLHFITQHDGQMIVFFISSPMSRVKNVCLFKGCITFIPDCSVIYFHCACRTVKMPPNYSKSARCCKRMKAAIRTKLLWYLQQPTRKGRIQDDPYLQFNLWLNLLSTVKKRKEQRKLVLNVNEEHSAISLPKI